MTPEPDNSAPVYWREYAWEFVAVLGALVSGIASASWWVALVVFWWLWPQPYPRPKGKRGEPNNDPPAG